MAKTVPDTLCRASCLPGYTPPLKDDLQDGFADQGKTCTDEQNIAPYGTAREPLSSDPFARAGEKRSVDTYESRDQQR